MLILLRQGRLSKWFSGIGQEAIAVGVAAALRLDDPILPLHRNLGVFTGRGLDLGTLFRQLLGRDGGYTGGRDRTFHFGAPEHHVIGMISHLGAMLPVADGMALAFQLKGESRVAAVFSGDGGTSEGDFHEAVNLAAVWKLPVLFVIENNQYGLSTPVSEQYACARLSDKGIGYGMAAETVDGNDLLAVVDAVSRAAARGRAGEGPTLLEFMTFRMRGHEEASGVAYVPAHLFEEWAARDPIARFEQSLLDQGVLTAADRDAIRAAFKAHIDRIADEAYEAPEPESTAERELADVYAPPDGQSRRRDGTMTRCREARPRDGERHGASDAPCDGAPRGPRPPPSPNPAGGARRHARSALHRRHYRGLRDRHAPGSSRHSVGAGHRGVRRRLQGHRGLRRGVRQGARAQHADHRIRRPGRGDGPGARGAAADGRDAVWRLHHLRLQPDRQQLRQDALPLGRRAADRDSGAGGRRHRRRPVSFAESGGVVHPRRRAESGGAGHAGRRQGPAAGGVRRRQPGAVSRAQVPVPLGQRTGARRRRSRRPSGRRAWRARGAT